MNCRETLDGMRQISVSETNTLGLVELGTVSVDMAKPVSERMRKFMSDVGNPYCYRCNEVAVKVEFQNSGGVLQEKLAGFLIAKKQNM